MNLPRSRRLSLRPLSRSLLVALAVAPAVALVACKSSERVRPNERVAPTEAPSASPAVEPDDSERPLHPGHINQRDPNGGFLGARTAPPPVHDAPIRPALLDAIPEEAKLAPVTERNGHCGELDLGGGEKVLLDCLTEDYGRFAGAATFIVGAEDLSQARGRRKLPALVDHRKDGTEGPVMNQSATAMCTSFSLATAADHAAAHFLGSPPSLSPMHAWARYHMPVMSLADRDNVGKGLTDLATLPFDSRLANEWQRGGRVDPALLRRADAESLVEITNITRIETNDLNEIKSVLASGQDVWFAIKAAQGVKNTRRGADGESMVANFDWKTMPSSQRSAHAIVLAGYQDTPKGTFFLIHNSWGPRWGTEGYAWIWDKTLRANIVDAYVLQVRPTERAHTRRPPSAHRYSTCRGQLTPDAVTGQCVPACQDGGPRVNGVCPTAGQCPDGEVNLDGRCELSGPDIKKTFSNGVRVRCGLSGCTYDVPNGAESCTSPQGCTISCAAPRFMLGSGPRGLVCNG